MTEETPAKKRPLVVNPHRRRPVGIWIVPLVIIVAVIYFLPRLLALLEG